MSKIKYLIGIRNAAVQIVGMTARVAGWALEWRHELTFSEVETNRARPTLLVDHINTIAEVDGQHTIRE